MIYRMIMGDLLRFVTIYVVFVMGFSQGKRLVPNNSRVERVFNSNINQREADIHD